MKKEMSVYIADILGSIKLIEDYIKGSSYESFEKDTGLQDKVLRRLEIIGEAASRLTVDFKGKNKEIPWKQIIGLRNIIIHDYSIVNLKEVWNIVTKDLPVTKARIKNAKT